MNSAKQSNKNSRTIDSKDRGRTLGSPDYGGTGEARVRVGDQDEHELIDDTFNVQDIKHLDEEVKRG